MFAAVRHPDVTALGVIPYGAIEGQRVMGWYRVSPWVDSPDDLYLPDYAGSYVDLDAEPEPAKKTKVSPAVPEKDEEAA